MIKKLQAYMGRVGQRLKSMKEGRRLAVFSLTHNSESLNIESLSVENEKKNIQIHWNEVLSASAFETNLTLLYTKEPIGIGLPIN
jgi:hypothetical protein